MKVLKIFGFIILIVVLLVLISGFFLPKSITMGESIMIDAPEEMIFNQVNNLQNWKDWSPFEEDDSTMISTYEGPEAGVGAKHNWISKIQENGSLTIAESDPYHKIITKLDFMENGTGTGTWSFNEKDDSINVTWQMEMTELSYPFGRIMGLFMPGMMEPYFKKGLKNLKKVAEKKATECRKAAVMEKQVELKHTLTITDSVKLEEMSNALESMFRKIMKYMNQENIGMSSPPFAIYHSWNPQGYSKIEAGIVVEKEKQGTDDIKASTLPAGKVVWTKHFGPYSSAEAHNRIDNYLKEHNLTSKGPVWEVYVTDPKIETDTMKWESHIYYLVE